MPGLCGHVSGGGLWTGTVPGKNGSSLEERSFRAGGAGDSTALALLHESGGWLSGSADSLCGVSGENSSEGCSIGTAGGRRERAEGVGGLRTAEKRGTGKGGGRTAFHAARNASLVAANFFHSRGSGGG